MKCILCLLLVIAILSVMHHRRQAEQDHTELVTSSRARSDNLPRSGGSAVDICAGRLSVSKAG
jgi:hypothetical protein